MSEITALSLFQIESDLMQLLAMAEGPGLQPDEKEALQAQTAAYFIAETRKVNGIAGAVRRCKSAAAEVREEIQRLTAIKEAWEERERRIKDNAMYAMETYGVRVLETPTSKLRIQGNGGVEALEIDIDALPYSFKDLTVTIPADQWNLVAEWIHGTEPHANHQRIREALKHGSVPGARLVPKGKHLRVE